MNHKFGQVQHTNSDNDQPYRKCEKCGKVMFEYGDDHFNMVCSEAVKDREYLRQKLEGKNI